MTRLIPVIHTLLPLRAPAILSPTRLRGRRRRRRRGGNAQATTDLRLGAEGVAGAIVIGADDAWDGGERRRGGIGGGDALAAAWGGGGRGAELGGCADVVGGAGGVVADSAGDDGGLGDAGEAEAAVVWVGFYG